MPLKGDASQIPLVNIFQTLQLNGQEGVLLVSGGKIRRKMRILPNGVRLLAAGRENPDALRTALVKMKILTEAQFQNALSTMGQPPGYPGEFLLARRIITADQVAKGVAKQFRELIYEIFSWSKARYEFNAGDPGNDLEYFDPQGVGTSLIFPIPAILMDAARREDEWKRIRQDVPTDREIFVPVDRGAFLKPRNYDIDVEPASVLEIKKLINGEHAVESIIAECTLSPFEVLRLISVLFAAGEVRPLGPKEKKDLAEELRKKLKIREVIDIYRHLLESDPEDTDTRLKLISILERKKEGSPLLLEQYELLVEHFFRSGEYVPAMNYLEKITALDPLHVGALDKLFEIHHLSKNSREALDTARKLVEAVQAKKDFERGAEVLLKVVDLYPGEAFLYHHLADFFIFGNQTENAVIALKSVASIYEERGENVKFRKTYERIAALDPSEAPSLKKVMETERRRTRRTDFHPSRMGIWTTLGAVFLAGVFYLAILEGMARRAYGMVEEDVRACSQAGDFRTARVILEDIARRFPLSTISARLSSLEHELSQKERDRDELRHKDDEREKVLFGSFLARLEPLMSGRRYMEALGLAEETGRQALSPANRRKVTAVQNEIRQYFGSAAGILKEAQEKIAAGRNEEAHRQYLMVLMNYANTPAAQGLKMPLLVKSTPPGAAVTMNGEQAGATPVTLYYNPFTRLNLSLSKDGFRPVQLGDDARFDFTRDWMLSFRLERIPAWTLDARAPVECSPLLRDGRAYVGTRGGRILCIDLARGTESWSYDVPDGWDVASGLREHKNLILFGTFDGALHGIDAKTGKPLMRLVPFSPPRPIRNAASEVTEAGLLAVNCGGSAVVGVNAPAGSVAWTWRGDAEVLGSPELTRGTFVFVTTDGTVHVLDSATGSACSKIPLGTKVEAPGRAIENSYILADRSGRIRRLHLGTGAVEWTYDSPMENPTAPAIGGGLVFFGSDGGLMAALDVKSGDLRWKGKVNDRIITPALHWKGSFYVGTRSGQALALDVATGTPLWSFASAGPVAAPPAGGGNFVLFGSDDHRVYAFTEK